MPKAQLLAAEGTLTTVVPHFSCRHKPTRRAPEADPQFCHPAVLSLWFVMIAMQAERHRARPYPSAHSIPKVYSTSTTHTPTARTRSRSFTLPTVAQLHSLGAVVLWSSALLAHRTDPFPGQTLLPQPQPLRSRPWLGDRTFLLSDAEREF